MILAAKLLIITVIIWGTLFLYPILSTNNTKLMSEVNAVESQTLMFNASRVYDLIQKQVDIGPRYPGSVGIENTRKLISSELFNYGSWNIHYQNFTKKWIENEIITCVNMICDPINRNKDEPSFLLLAHYDSRLWASEDPNPQKRKLSVPGANDGASGVAVILELGRIFLEEYNISNFQLVFFDAEDQGGINGWDWLIGSRYYAVSQIFLDEKLSFGILFDMVAGEGATFKREQNSDQYAKELVSWIWGEAESLDFQNYFLNSSGRRILDDHVPLLEQGLPVIDIIDEFGTRYKPWHTTFDNMTYIDEKTINSVGYTVESAVVKLINTSEFVTNFPTFEFKSPFSIYYSFGIIILSIIKIQNNKKKNLTLLVHT
jgi:hypothetical protein